MTDFSNSKRSPEKILDDILPPKKKVCSEEPLAQVLEDTVEVKDEELQGLAVDLDVTLDQFIRATEEDVGITEYISDLPGFSAVLKQRYSDFLVNEIDLQGQLVKLTDMNKPMNLTDFYEIKELLKADIIEKLHALSDGNETEVLIEVTDEDKNFRKKIHEVIRQNFQGIDTVTVDKDDKKLIVAKKQSPKSKGRRFQPSPAGNYLHFVLYKENRDTMNAINTIASYLRLPPKTFSYAGTKDKRGKTSQRVSAYRISVERLMSINKAFNKIKVGNVTYNNEQIILGDLLGNYFVIILRQLDGDLDVIEKSMKSLSSNGFINYYGLQRFGTLSVPTHTIGRALLLGDWKSAINLILQPKSEGDKNLTNLNNDGAKKEENIYKKTYPNSKNRASIEEKLLHGLSCNNENDLVNALNAIPRNTRLLYIHSYQSFVWNRVLSERIKKHGLKVLPGDLIANNSEVVQEELPGVEKFEKRRAQLANEVKYVSREEVEKISIGDVLLPLPGHSVLYPENECKEWYETFLKKDGIDWSNFESKVKTYSLSGTYRKIIIVPSELKWEIIPYEDTTEPLVLSDLDILQQQTILTPSVASKKALKMEFKLPSSCYATMAVREVLKSSTAYSFKRSEKQFSTVDNEDADSVPLPASSDKKSDGEHDTMMSLEETPDEESNGNQDKENTMMARILKCMENVQQELKLLNKKVADLSTDIKDLKARSGHDDTSNHMFVDFPSDLQIPLTSDEELLQLNSELLKNKRLQANLIHFLAASSHGKTVQKLLLSIIRTLLTRDVAVLYSRLGRKGKKCFQNLKGVYHVVLESASQRYPNVKKEDLADSLGKVLAGATDWDGLRKSNSKVQRFELTTEDDDVY